LRTARLAVTIDFVPRVRPDQLEARRQEILAGARACFARYGYEGATVRLLEKEIGLSRGAIFHHFRDKESLFIAVAEDDAATMIATVAEHGLVQVMRNLLARSAADGETPADADSELDTAGWLGSQLEVSRRLRTDPDFASRWSAPSAALATATRERLRRQREAGVLRADIPIETLAQFLELAYDGLVLHLAMGGPAQNLDRVLDLVEAAVRRPAALPGSASTQPPHS
jgi:TetR/AcrR family transcriptional regulator, transcriptional repressor of aconitase